VKLIIGLGNPGQKYSGTRHNAGRLLAEKIADARGKSWKTQPACKSLTTSFEWEGQQVLLACPETFMNLSGEAVRLLVQFYKVDASRDLLVMVDEVALPLGTLRLRASGSDGGHNGLKSIQEALAGENYPRLRIGVGGPGEKTALEDYVLQPFEAAERKQLEAVLERGFEACRLWLTQPVERVMNAINASPEKG
jgi:peptidyl-tRNA hydrolase, PTH1 family